MLVKHFENRWIERGNPKYSAQIISDILRREHRLIRTTSHSDALDFVMEVTNEKHADGERRCMYRFRIEETPYYAIISEPTGAPITILTHDQMRKEKKKIKRQRRALSVRSLGGKLMRRRAERSRERTTK